MSPSVSQDSFPADLPHVQEPHDHSSETPDVRAMRRRYGSMSSSELRLVRAEELTQGVAGRVATTGSFELNAPVTSTGMSASQTVWVQQLSGRSDQEGKAEEEGMEQAVFSYFPPAGVVLVLRLCGVALRDRPRRRCWSMFGAAILSVFSAAALAAPIGDMVMHRKDPLRIDTSDCPRCVWLHGTLGHCVVAITAVLSLVAARHSWRPRTLESQAASLQAAIQMLTSYAHQHDFTDVWDGAWRRDFRLSLLLWASALVVCLVSIVHDCFVQPAGFRIDMGRLLQVVSVLFLHGLLHCVNLCILRVCRCLGLTVDIFCAEIVSEKDLDAATT
eukprot:CAMPEP_0170207332 /NCGR_PEP_ID=MMETSP0116_2-20130129/3243_1 /TAXON_ID=400756 /ORGANISM="Durinskia baltica, Strain CSIRO CS-38" /LENGTH=330 /DNA_ID=CAMNT_0010457789 /DNA_START=6 /DNA_END=994 /DNA_ORIENTATION=-